jgi:hypothetical protein
MKGRIGAWFICLSLIFAGHVHSAVVVVDTTGFNNETTYGFYGITFQSGTTNEYIRGVDFLLAFDGAYFDFDGGGSYSNLFVPVFGPLNGVAQEDITFGSGNIVGGNTLHPGLLTIEFTPQAFKPGDSVRFAADTDGMPGNSGADFAGRVCFIIVTLNIGTSVNNMVAVSTTRAEVAAVVTNQVILSATRAGNDLELSWPWFAEHAVLEQTTSPAAQWITSPVIPTYTGSSRRAVVPLDSAYRFYRLREP